MWSLTYRFKVRIQMASLPKVARIKPPVLQAGDTVGIVAPASNVRADDLEAGCAALRGRSSVPGAGTVQTIFSILWI